MSKSGNMEIINDFLKTLQHDNNQVINDEINKFLLEEEDFKGLYNSIQTYSNYDQNLILNEISKSDLPEMKRISALIYRKNKQYDKALQLCQEWKLYQDAMETVRECNNPELATNLIEFFLSKEMYEH